MNTVTEHLRDMRNGLGGLLDRLMEASTVRERNQESDVLVLIGPSYEWCELDLEARRIQSKFFDDYDRFIELIRSLLTGGPAESRADLEAGDGEVRMIVGQATPTYYTKDEAFAAVQRRLEDMVAAVNDLYDASEGSSIVVPDTNALLYNPDLEAWRFDDLPQFTVALVPEVLRELDSLKIDHKNPNIRERAESIIRRIGEYGRRGRLDQGVPLKKGLSQVRSIALEPRVKQALSWLDPAKPDDRVLASFIEIMRSHPRSVVVLVTRDINLRNKAVFAQLPVWFPPEKAEMQGVEAHNPSAPPVG